MEAPIINDLFSTVPYSYGSAIKAGAPPPPPISTLMNHKVMKEIDEKEVHEEGFVSSSQDAESLQSSPGGEHGLTRQLKNRHIAMIRY